MLKSIIEDMKYMIDNIKTFGFSISGVKADMSYMLENIMRIRESDTTIRECVKTISAQREINQLYVHDRKGNYITASGDMKVKNLKVVDYGDFVDLEFTV